MKIFNTRAILFLLFGYIFVSFNCLSIKQPKLWNLSNENPFFVGREGKLKEMHSFFKKGGTIFALTGGPGFGKTQTAKRYAQQFQNDYTLIWWIDAQQDIPSQFEKLAIALNYTLSEKEKINPSVLSKDSLIDRVKDILRVKNITYLLVFDNAETYDKIQKYIPYAHHHSGKHVLLTSRYANIWTDKVEIGKFERQESITLIKKTLSKEKYADIEKLAESLSDYPLGLTIAVGFIKSYPTTSIKKYLEIYMKRTLKKSEQSPSTLLDSYPNNVLRTLEISLRFIEDNSKDALETLFFMSLLNSKDIPESYVENWLKKTKSNLTADEAIKYIYDQSLIGISETTEFDKQKMSEGRAIMNYLSIHDLIHQLINEKISPEEKRKLLDTATDVMLEVFAGTSEVFIKKVMQEPIHLLHAQKLINNAKEVDYLTPKLLKLKACVFECLMGPTRNFEAAKLIREEIENNLRSGIKLEPYHEALFNINKGFFECTVNANYDDAIRYMSKGLTLLPLQKEYNEERLRAIANLSQYHSLRGETDIAETYINKGKSLFNDAQSVAYKSFFINVWSLVFTDQGKFKDSEQVLIRVKEFPFLYPVFEHAILHQKLETSIKQGKLNECSEYLTEYEKKVKEFFQGKKGMGLANIFFFKALLLIHKKKNISTALQHLTESLKIYKETFHEDKKHRSQGRTHLAMGKAYAILNDFQSALKELLLSKEIYDKVLKEQKIDDVSDLYKELAILGAAMKDEGITHKYLNAHIETFGIDHPRTEQILKHLDQLGLPVPN